MALIYSNSFRWLHRVTWTFFFFLLESLEFNDYLSNDFVHFQSKSPLQVCRESSHHVVNSWFRQKHLHEESLNIWYVYQWLTGFWTWYRVLHANPFRSVVWKFGYTLKSPREFRKAPVPGDLPACPPPADSVLLAWIPAQATEFLDIPQQESNL